jgi:hypothetical protein
MITLNFQQLQKIKNSCNDGFVSKVIVNLRAKQFDKVSKYNNNRLHELILFLVRWAGNYSVVIEADVEYLINIFFLYNLTENYMKSPEVRDIFSYPNRKAEDKVLTLHFMLENKND